MNNSGEQFQLRGTYLNTPPWITRSSITAIDQFEGPYGKLFNFLVSALNIKFSWHFTPDNQHGGRTAGGNWSGMIGMLIRNEADIMLSPLTITSARWSVIEYSPPVATLHLAILGGEPVEPAPMNVFGFFMTFDKEVWMVIFSFWFVVVFLALLIEYIWNDNVNWPFKLLSYATDFFGMIFLEASKQDPIENSARVLRCFWWMTVFVLMNAFQGHFKSSMVLKFDNKIESLEALFSKENVKPLIWKGVVYEDFFECSTSYRVWSGSKVAGNGGIRSVA